MVYGTPKFGKKEKGKEDRPFLGYFPAGKVAMPQMSSFGGLTLKPCRTSTISGCKVAYELDNDFAQPIDEPGSEGTPALFTCRVHYPDIVSGDGF